MVVEHVRLIEIFYHKMHFLFLPVSNPKVKPLVMPPRVSIGSHKQMVLTTLQGHIFQISTFERGLKDQLILKRRGTSGLAAVDEFVLVVRWE